MLHHVDWQIATDVTEYLSDSKFSIKQAKDITLKMEAVCTVDTSVITHIYQLLQRNVPDDVKLPQQSCKNLKSHISKYCQKADL